MDPQGVPRKGVRGPWRTDIKVKYYNKTNLFKKFRGPQAVNLDCLGVRKDLFIILGVHRTKKVKNHCSNEWSGSNEHKSFFILNINPYCFCCKD